MKIKKINSLHEGLDSNFDFAQANIDIQNDGGAKGIKQSMINIQKFIDNWDPQGLTKNFASILASRFSSQGINSGDVVIKWLTQTDDDNIKNLDVKSAETLFKLLDNKDLIYNDSYIIENNNLFTGTSKDISYKLNALAIILDPDKVDKYKNSKGETPTINLLQSENGDFLDANQIRKNLDGFVDEGRQGDGNEIPFLTWARIIGNAQKGQEWQYFKKMVSSLYRGDQYKELRAQIFSDLKLLRLNYPQKLKNLGAKEVPQNGNPQTIIPIMVEAIQNKEYDTVRGTNKLLIYAIMANLNDKDWDHDDQVSSPKNLQLILNKLLKDDPQFSKYSGLIKILLSQQSLITKLMNSTVPNTKPSTIINFIKKFIDTNIKIV